ncbi:MAG: nuclear transport factor 2 family protein [Nocardioides sp.]|nr:nuclear transport factor 2 family protein [Nocardioides sp.]
MAADPIGEQYDVEQIRALKYRYLRHLDLKQWEEFAEVFVPEATGAYAGLDFGDRDALVSYMRENMGPGLISMHHVHHPEITIGVDGDPDRARGTWYLEDKVLVPEYDFVLEGAAFYDDVYVRTADGWRVAHTGYRRTYEVSYTMSSIQNYKLKLGTAYDGRARV